MTVKELIYDSMRLVSVLHTGEGPNTDEHAENLRALNTMLDSWANESLMVYQIADALYPWPAGVGSRSLGPGGDFNAPRPVRVETAVWIVDQMRAPLELMTHQMWASRGAGGGPWDYGRAGIWSSGEYPATTLWITPVPANDGALELGTWVPLTAFASLDDTVSLPPGYMEAIQYNLAIRLAPRYREAVVSPLVESMARTSKGDVKRINWKPPILQVDGALIDYDLWVWGDYR